MITPDVNDFYQTSNEPEGDKDRRGDQQHRFTFGRAKTPTKVDEPQRESVEDELRQQLKQMEIELVATAR